MKTALHFLKWASMTIVVLLAASIVIPFLMQGLGYYTLEPGWKVAEQLVEEDKDVDDCRKILRIFWFDFLSPPQTLQRMECRYEYAKLTKDPKACEGLMPSDYGWSCLGAAEKPNARACWFNFAPDPPEVGRGDKHVKLPECAQDPASMVLNRCCELARILYIEKQQSCEEVSDSDTLHDQCLELLAMRERNINLCTDIRSDHIRATCTVAVSALSMDRDASAEKW